MRYMCLVSLFFSNYFEDVLGYSTMDLFILLIFIWVPSCSCLNSDIGKQIALLPHFCWWLIHWKWFWRSSYFYLPSNEWFIPIGSHEWILVWQILICYLSWMLRCCRFGYDYIGGYERMGGRPGYPDEKSHGRFMNRSGGYQNMPFGNCFITFPWCPLIANLAFLLG